MTRGVDASMLAALGESVIRPAYFVHLGFGDPVTIWTGNGEVTSHSKDWQPYSGELGISDLSEALDGSQPRLSVTLTGYGPDSFQPPTGIGSSITVTEYTTGGQSTYTVPANCLSVTFEAWGCDGEDGDALHYLYDPGGNHTYLRTMTGPGGRGGYVKGAVVAPTAGTQYRVVVGDHSGNGFGGAQTLTMPITISYGELGDLAMRGGGLSGIFSGSGSVSASDASRAIIVAGGGAGFQLGDTFGYITLYDPPLANEVFSVRSKSAYAGHPGSFGSSMQGAGSAFHVPGGTDPASYVAGAGGGYYGGAITAPTSSAYVWHYTTGGTNYADSGLLSVENLPGNAASESGATFGKVKITTEVEIVESYDVPAQIYFGLVDTDGAIIGSPQLMFSGYVSATRFAVDPTRQITATVELYGAPAIVEAKTAKRYTDTHQRSLYTGDLGLEYAEATAAVKLRFGATP